jgi:hypothetical protein
VIGVASQDTAAGQVVQYVAAGPLTLPTSVWDAITGGSGGLVVSANYYLSSTTLGHLTTDASAGGPLVGVALSPTTLDVSGIGSDLDAFIFGTGQGSAIQNNGTGNQALGVGAVAEGTSTLASGPSAHAEGATTTASGFDAHAEGDGTIASGAVSHAEGLASIASGGVSHAEGTNTRASNLNSHAEGVATLASGIASHAEGQATVASGDNSHAEGISSVASAEEAHAEGIGTVASGIGSHAEGFATEANDAFSHASGNRSIASRQTQEAFASGGFAAVNGSCQTSRLVLRGTTPGAVITETIELKFGGAADQTLQLEDGKTYTFEVTAAAGGVQAGPGRVSVGFKLDFNVRRDAGVTVFSGGGATRTATAIDGDATAATWTLVASIGVAPDRVVLTFSTGAEASAAACHVSAEVKFTEAAF